ncbi:F-box domain-containing protein [Mycena chlorophos]|uniref:F-box domain-containing protein n=1 Tax=Mycena chlorophos TaxID=658473 RepID=A0A8H6T9V6_MYCCL|nr:F-box domain-containing protein [Mycena chlorophos]
MLSTLPPEILIAICRWLDAVSVARFCRISKRFHRLIKHSSAVQYAVALELAGLSDISNSSFATSSSARLSALLAYNDAWKNIDPESRAFQTQCKLTGKYWELVGNVFATYSADDGFAFSRIPCAIKSLQPDHWKLPVFTGSIVDFSMDLSQDLLVVVEVASLGLSVHLLSLHTGQPHPAARLFRLVRQVEEPPVSTFEAFQIRIFGTYMAVMSEIDTEVSACELLVWDWKTGALKKHMYGPTLTSFAFLDAKRLIVTFLDDESAKITPQLSIVDVEGPLDPCTLLLPAIDRGDPSEIELLLLTESAPSWPENATRECPFATSHADRLFVVSLCGLELEDDGSVTTDCSFFLCVRLSTILDVLDANPSKACIDWADWGPTQTRMLRIPKGFSETWVCCVYGLRCAIQPSRNTCQILDFTSFYTSTDNRIVHPTQVDKKHRFFLESVTTHAPFTLQKVAIPASMAVMLTEDGLVTVSLDEESCSIYSVV